ncbi:MAG: class I SAM-dependent methyltransferase [Anaerolineae bacterium]|nr:class I SAM-dependent methyltransferase [Anaerolineae bacterium]
MLELEQVCHQNYSKKAGLSIYGMDGSKEMLSICKEKRIATELVEHDITVLPWPYPDSSMNHVICCGVFHFIKDLDGIFSEIRRIQRKDGLFAFTVKKVIADVSRDDCCQQIEDGIPTYTHNRGYINGLLRKYQYAKLKETISFVGDSPFIVTSSRKG